MVGVFTTSRLLIAGHLAILLSTKWPMKIFFGRMAGNSHNPTIFVNTTHGAVFPKFVLFCSVL
jgi:hypothetical protein